MCRKREGAETASEKAVRLSNMKRLLIVAHAPSPNTRRLRDAAECGARHPDIDAVEVVVKPPLDAGPRDIRRCDAILLGTTENLGYMSGALKDFFDRSYYAVLEEKQGLPCALYIRAGHDGTGTRRAVESIVSGLCWRWAQEPLVLRGEWQDSFVDHVEELGLYLAAGLEAGVL
ncbi:flavodoxin family protein [Halomonas sp. DX6]|uniref:Flavodoxin family protein n=2 Tax=Billgrantia bachuensis TaxID=2717286 RepID=A0ABX0PV88_9GAMM|nr:flavodoxin family protein [Halomonas bachuensis]